MKRVTIENVEEVDVIKELNNDLDDCYMHMNEMFEKAVMWGIEYSEQAEFSAKDVQTQLNLSVILEACEYIETACKRIDKAIENLDRMWVEDDGE